MSEQGRGLLHVLAAYVVAIAAGFVTLVIVEGDPLWRAFVADIVATVVIWGFSRAYRNSSFYDAYWSVIPPLFGVYWIWAMDDVGPRAWLVVALVFYWGIRLTWNWAKHWQGLSHEDWRYPMVRDRHPRMALFTDFFGIHLFPTLQVFLGCIPMYAAIRWSSGELNWLDGVAAIVTFGAVTIQMIADLQLRGFLKRAKPGEVIRDGLWGWSRHPNYFGEVSFWGGLALFGLAAHPEGWWWLILGFLAMLLMFIFASIPMMEKRSLERRPAYAEVMREVSMLVPLPPRR